MRGRAYKCTSVDNDMLFESQRGVALSVCVPVCLPVCLRVCLCVGGSDSTEWEDITGSTQMTVVKGCVSFTSAVSARSVTTVIERRSFGRRTSLTCARPAADG